jgi:hypothetical protein
MAIKEQRMVSLAPTIFAALDALAVKTNSVARRGPKARQHSWHVMLERIAKGDIIIQEREPWSLPPGLAEQADAVEERQRLEQQHTAQKQAERKAPLKMEQLSMLEPA